MAKAKKRARRRGKSADADTGEPEQTGPEFPKRMVKLTPGPGDSVVTDVQRAGDADQESALTEGGYKPLEFAEEERPSYPCWRYNLSDGSRRIVNSEEDEDALGEGDWSDSPEGLEDQPVPVETDLARAEQTLGGPIAAKLDLFLSRALGMPEVAKRADGNFDPSTIPIARGSRESQDATVLNSRSTAEARTGKR
jgi:hypothetical protein